MNDLVGLAPAAFLDRLERSAWRTETPCGDGTMVWRSWGEGPVLVLFHGGAGSWRHWAHNIDVLSQQYRLLVPDLPGLGESAFPPDGDDAMAVATIVAHGIDIVLGADERYDVAGFSFGGTMATCVGAIHGARVRSVTIIGSSGVGPAGSAVELLKVRHLSGEERVATHRINLNRLMIADPGEDRRSGAGDPGVEHAAFAAEDADAVAQRCVAECAEAGGVAGERHLGRARCTGQSARAAARRGAACAAAGCRCADDPGRRPLGGVRGAGAVQRDAAGDAEAHQAVGHPGRARRGPCHCEERSDEAISIGLEIASLRSQ